MEKPAAKDPKLKNIVENLYKPTATTGSGSTAAAVRNEIITGKPAKGRFHFDKSKKYLTGLEKWLSRYQYDPKVSAQDIQTAKNLARDLKGALNGK